MRRDSKNAISNTHLFKSFGLKNRFNMFNDKIIFSSADSINYNSFNLSLKSDLTRKLFGDMYKFYHMYVNSNVSCQHNRRDNSHPCFIQSFPKL